MMTSKEFLESIGVPDDIFLVCNPGLMTETLKSDINREFESALRERKTELALIVNKELCSLCANYLADHGYYVRASFSVHSDKANINVFAMHDFPYTENCIVRSDGIESFQIYRGDNPKYFKPEDGQYE